MSKQEELEKIQTQKKNLFLTLAKIRDMVNKGVVVNGIGNNTIEFVDGLNTKQCSIASGYYTQITPSDLKDAKQFFKKEHQQWLDKAGEFDLLEKKENALKKELEANSDF